MVKEGGLVICNDASAISSSRDCCGRSVAYFRATVFLFSSKNSLNSLEGKGWRGVAEERETKVSRTLAEALISSRLHRPRSDPLGASQPSN